MSRRYHVGRVVRDSPEPFEEPQARKRKADRSASGFKERLVLPPPISISMSLQEMVESTVLCHRVTRTCDRPRARPRGNKLKRKKSGKSLCSKNFSHLPIKNKKGGKATGSRMNQVTTNIFQAGRNRGKSRDFEGASNDCRTSPIICEQKPRLSGH